MHIDKAIKGFVDFLNSSWLVVYPLLVKRNYTSNEESINDWLQANWELLVERKVLNINEYLEVYGDGADYHGASSRITDIEALTTFRVIVNPKKNINIIHDILNDEYVKIENVTFSKIVGFEKGFYLIEPEFKYVLITDDVLGKERVVALGDIEFGLERL